MPTVRFWGWAENKREEEMDFKELSARAQQGLPLYGESSQPEWVQASAYRNSAFSQLKFGVCHIFTTGFSADVVMQRCSPCKMASTTCKNLLTNWLYPFPLLRVNLVHHQHHGTDPEKYKPKTDESS